MSPDTLFQRDDSAWVYTGVSVNPMAKPARQRESIRSRAVCRSHPTCAGAAVPMFFAGQMIAVPDRFQERVGEPEVQPVHDLLLAEK